MIPNIWRIFYAFNKTPNADWTSVNGHLWRCYFAKSETSNSCALKWMLSNSFVWRYTSPRLECGCSVALANQPQQHTMCYVNVKVYGYWATRYGRWQSRKNTITRSTASGSLFTAAARKNADAHWPTSFQKILDGNFFNTLRQRSL